MAAQPSEVYHSMQNVFDMYEKGELKGQKAHSRLTEVGKKKALQGQLSPKLHHFKVFQGLKVLWCYCRR